MPLSFYIRKLYHIFMVSQLSQNQKGMLLALAGYGAFSCSDAAIKILAPHYPVLQILAVQTGLAAMFLCLCAGFLGGWRGFNDRGDLKLHALRIFCNICVCSLLFTSLAIMPITSVYAMIFAIPFFSVMIARLIYGETISKARWGVLIAGFIGIMIILRPLPESFQPQLLIPLGAAFFSALMFTAARSFKAASPFVMTIFPLVGTCLCALPFAFLGTPDFKHLFISGEFALLPSAAITSAHLPFFLMTAFFSGAAILCISLAFRITDASIVSPFLYTQMIWGLALGYLVFGNFPDGWTLLGSGVIITAGLSLIAHERIKKTA